VYPTFTELSRVELTLYTDALITRGWVRTRQHRVTDILNHAEAPFLVLEDVTVDEIGDRGVPIRADVAQINLDAVLFAVADVPIERQRDLLARFRFASRDERAWIRDVMRRHCAEHFPDVEAP